MLYIATIEAMPIQTRPYLLYLDILSIMFVDPSWQSCATEVPEQGKVKAQCRVRFTDLTILDFESDREDYRSLLWLTQCTNPPYRVDEYVFADLRTTMIT